MRLGDFPDSFLDCLPPQQVVLPVLKAREKLWVPQVLFLPAEHKNSCLVGCRTAQDIGSTWEPDQLQGAWFEKGLPDTHCSSVGRCGHKEMSELGYGYSLTQGPWDSVGAIFVILED